MLCYFQGLRQKYLECLIKKSSTNRDGYTLNPYEVVSEYILRFKDVKHFM